MDTVPCGRPGFLAEASRLVVVGCVRLAGLGVEGVECTDGEIQKCQREGYNYLYQFGDEISWLSDGGSTVLGSDSWFIFCFS